MTRPDISVIIGAYNAMPYLTRTLTSVVEQSIGHGRMEIITVNDGSTDGTGEELERFAADYPGLFKVFHQENSGGPSGPRNVGLEHAAGRFVFFLDADDYLGEEALERMLAAAEKNRTDVVLGKMVGVNGRGAPASMFLRNQPRTDVFSSRVYWALNPLKLFRRDLLERHKLRFPTGYKVCEDQFFTALAYLNADGISVVADYECLYIVKRDDGGNITLTTRGSQQRIQTLRMMVDLVEEHVPAGPDRDTLMNRHLSIDMFHALIHLVAEPDEAVRKKGLTDLQELLSRSYPDSLKERVNAITRLRCELIRRGLLDELIELERVDRRHRTAGTSPDVLIKDGRAYVGLPFFRDADRGIPDECYDITRDLQARHRLDTVSLDGSRLTLEGHGYLRRVTEPRTGAELILRELTTKAEHRFPVATVPTTGLGADEDGGLFDYPDAGFAVTVDLMRAVDGGRLPKGLWNVFLAVEAGGVRREIRIGHKRLPTVEGSPRTYVVNGDGHEEPMAVALYFTHPYDNLNVDVGENKHRVADKLSVTGTARAEGKGATLTVTGSWKLSALPVDTLCVRMTGEDGDKRDFPVSPVGTNGFVAHVPVDGLPVGTWVATLRLASGKNAAWTAPVPPQRDLAPLHWRRFGLPWYAKPASSGKFLSLRVGRVDIVRGAVARLKQR
ncbi:glycosyltransferase [Streptomyces altiplanensis]